MINPKDLDFSNWGYGSPVQSTGQTSVTRKPSGGTNSITNVGDPAGSLNGGGTAMPMENFQYPSEWDQAGNTWGQLASGNYSNPGMDWLQNMMGSGGNQFDVGGWDAMYRPAMMDQYSNAVKQMAEQAGMGGVRYGSGLQNAIGNYGGQLQNQYTKDLWDRMYGAHEAGQNRASGAASLLSQLGLGARESGAQGLLSLGNYRSQLPLQVAGAMGGLGQQQTAQQVDPWTQMMMSLIGGTGQAYPQTYTPSGFQSFLQGILPGLSGLFGGGANPATMAGGLAGRLAGG